MRRRRPRGALPAPAALLLLLACAPAAQAHAVLTASSPARGATLERPPTEVVLSFNEAVRPAAVRVLDATGHQAEYAAPPRAEGRRVYQSLAGSLEPGSHLVFWRVIAEDGHVSSSSFAFSVAPMPQAVPRPAVAAAGSAGPAPAAPNVPGAESEPAVRQSMLAAVNCALLYAAGLLLLGSLLLLAWMPWPETTRGIVVRQGRLAALLFAASLALAPTLVAIAGFGSSLMRSAEFGVAGAMLGWIALGTRSRVLRYGAAALVLLSFLVTGHAATAPPVMIVAPMVGMHVVTAAFWSAALWPLLAASARLGARECGALLDAFSAVAAGLVLLLLVSGAVLMLVQLGPLHNLLRTGYGLRLSVKIAVALGLLGFAAVNNLRVTPAMRRGEVPAAQWFRITVRAEIALMLVVIALAASLTVSAPPRSFEPAARDAATAAQP